MIQLERKRIYAHRGLWASKASSNTSGAIASAIRHGFSLETDFRVNRAEIVIAHDADSEIYRADLQHVLQTSVAINLKEDGLLPYFEKWRQAIDVSNSFFFDGSIPEMYKYYKNGLPHALRLSEFELELPWNSPVIWLDAFESDWWLNSDSFKRILSFPRVVVVSPELHGRDHRAVWDAVLEATADGQENLSICTDYPDAFYEESNA